MPHSVPLYARLDAARAEVLPKGPAAEAISYALNQRKYLERYLGDGRIPIDNNAIERQMRSVAVGRRNWTFCGAEPGGHWAARLFGLMNTCKLQGVNPHAWLRDVLERVRIHPADRMAELTPRQWKRLRAAEVE